MRGVFQKKSPAAQFFLAKIALWEVIFKKIAFGGQFFLAKVAFWGVNFHIFFACGGLKQFFLNKNRCLRGDFLIFFRLRRTKISEITLNFYKFWRILWRALLTFTKFSKFSGGVNFYTPVLCWHRYELMCKRKRKPLSWFCIRKTTHKISLQTFLIKTSLKLRTKMCFSKSLQ